ncbi:NAD(P)H-hydrate epimerase [Microbacterium sp. NPDC056044]|uniref:NAD(P)H-hydrate epimerase n=1 Tax=Microbacterium sp. NPDC056044 TaxID=3345690 RepID=UPI0035DA1607
MSERVPTYTADQVRAAERPLIDAGVPLMHRAAAALADVVRAELATPDTVLTLTGVLEPVIRESPVALRPRVLVLAGSGDNGGDALYAAARLTGVADVDVLLVSERFHETALAAAVAAGVRRVDLPEVDDDLRHYALVVDGIVGIGSSADSALRGRARGVVTAIRDDLRRGGRMPRLIAVDLPSGLHPDTGAADDAVLAASVTVTFGAVKAGLATGRGPELCGDVVLVDIGLGSALQSVEPAGAASVSRIVTVWQDA